MELTRNEPELARIYLFISILWATFCVYQGTLRGDFVAPERAHNAAATVLVNTAQAPEVDCTGRGEAHAAYPAHESAPDAMEVVERNQPVLSNQQRGRPGGARPGQRDQSLKPLMGCAAYTTPAGRRQ
jgi:hypothetical protein